MKAMESMAVMVMAAALAAGGCNLKKKASAEEATAEAEETSTSATTSAVSAEPASGLAPEATTATGTFKYAFSPAKDAKFKTYEALFKPGGRLDVVTQAMGGIAMPRDVPVATGECGMENAVFIPKKHAIILCYELAHDWYQRFLKEGFADRDASKSTLDALTFTLLHEMGHALIHELELGVTGGEEDSVDDLAALILIQNKKAEWAIAGTYALMQMNKGQKPVYFDEHSIGEQRLYNVLCMIYGSDPEANAGILQKVPELKHRAAKCPTEYKRKDKAWTTMLDPHTRK